MLSYIQGTSVICLKKILTLLVLFSYQSIYQTRYIYNNLSFQAVEFLAEWSLTPSNVAFLRVHTGVCDPSQVGDKAKWFNHTLDPIIFSVWDENSSLATALNYLPQQEQPTGTYLFLAHS